jgi:hypothetical protein
LALYVSIHGRPPAKHNSQLLFHMPLLSNLTTKQWGNVDKSALHKLVICAGIPWNTVEAAIGEHDCGQQWDRRGRGGGGGEYTGECLFNNNSNDNKYVNNNKTTTHRMGRGRRGERTTGGIQLRRLQCPPRAVCRWHGAEDVLLVTPAAVELSVWIGFLGWGHPVEMRVCLWGIISLTVTKWAVGLQEGTGNSTLGGSCVGRLGRPGIRVRVGRQASGARRRRDSKTSQRLAIASTW